MNKLIEAKSQEPLKSYIELTHHSFTASNNKINVILENNKHLPKLTENYQW